MMKFSGSFQFECIPDFFFYMGKVGEIELSRVKENELLVLICSIIFSLSNTDAVRD